jgi:Skp family chaperone for outer membrane proteins
MLKSALGVVLIVCASPLAAAAQPSVSVPVAYFSPQRAFAASPEGKDVEARLSTLQAQRAKELDARNQRLTALQEALQKNGGVLAPGVRQEREREISLAAVAKERGLLFVINEDAGLLAWADPTADITFEVVSRLTSKVAK